VTGRRSAGLLLFRRPGGPVEVLIGHMGGPFWQRRDAGGWSIPKGEYDSDEEPLAAARREFEEELGVRPPASGYQELGEVRQSGGKIVTAWMVEGDLDPADVVPGTFALEWPKGSGRTVHFAELDRVAWVDLEEARRRVVTGQRPFLDRLADRLRGSAG
jgi:predicted NUDIX family NTP pyrophosphohydrolase